MSERFDVCGRCLGVIDERGPDICGCVAPAPMEARALHELRRLRALERALREWVGGKVPSWAESISLFVDGEAFVFGKDVLGLHPGIVADACEQLRRQGHLVTAAREALALIRKDVYDVTEEKRVKRMLRVALKGLKADG